jgi:hypothetical protein
MGNELQKPLAQRAKELLQTDEEHSLFELADLIRQFRNETHPDIYQDQNLKTKAEARFKEAQSLLEELEKQIELDRFNRKPSELVVYKPLYDATQLQSELDAIKKLLKDTQSELDIERAQNIELGEKLKIKSDDSLKSEIQYLQRLYQPSTSNYASIGLAIVLTGALGVMSQMERVSNILAQYSPFGREYVGRGLFVFLILFLITLARKVHEREYIRRKAEEVCSPKYVDDFITYLKSWRGENVPIVGFSEIEVYRFISGYRRWYKNAARWVGFQIYRPETLNRLKDIFIHNLINKRLINVSRAEMMQRHFTISSNPSEDIWYNEYIKERARNERLAKTGNA